MIPRNALPQIPANAIEEFRQFLEGYGVNTSYAKCNPADLTPIQKHLSKPKLESLSQDPKALTLPLIVNNHGRILDGHHRWGAQVLNKEQVVECLVCECGIYKLVELAHEFPKATIKSLSEVRG
jgi:hypothetical protein